MLSLQVFTQGDTMLADFTGRVHLGNGGGMRFSTNAHGFDALECSLIPMGLLEAFECYDWPGTPRAVVSDPVMGVVWEGRVEDVAIVEGGISLVAFGYQRALRDVLYTALWSDTSSAVWEPITNTMSSTYDTQQYEADNNNRLYLALRQGESYANGSDLGAFTYLIPDDSVRNITNFDCTYSMVLPSGWLFRLTATTEAFGSSATLNSITATGSGQSGTLNLTLGTPKARINAWIRNDTGTTSTPTVPTGDYYLRLTGLRVKTTTASTVLASSIAAALESYVDGINGNQISGNNALISATTTDLQDELYEDETPADILDRLALLHGYEWGVYEERRLHFRPKGSAGRAWYVDVTTIVNLQRSLENVRNSAYGRYRDASGRLLRTAVANSTDSQGRYGVIRQAVVDVDTTSATEAGIHRDVYLTDRANASSRAEIRFSRLYDATGGEFPLYAIRAGDTVTMRNLPPTLSPTVDRIRTFVVSETDYDAMRDEISIAPETPTPSLEKLIARRDAGVR